MIRVQQLQRMLMATVFVAPIFACSAAPPLLLTSEPTSVESTATYKALRSLPAPARPVPVAVYSYPDLTGQLKPTETVSTNSRAVTQGAVWMLMKSLKDAGGGRWFKVIQRANLDHLLKERQIIRETRGRVEKETGQTQPQLPSLLFAGTILEGGIIGYDSNTVSGGIGARYLGIGGDAQYRQDTVTVYLNAISSQTGEIVKSVMTRKTVASYGVRGSLFKFVSFQKLLEAETGYTVNEPGQIAVAQAIEHAVRALIIEGALEGHWQFEDEVAGKEQTQIYLAEKEDDLLLGDAENAVAQTLLTEDQLAKLAQARQAKRLRLAAQAKRKQEIALAKRSARPEAGAPVPPQRSVKPKLPAASPRSITPKAAPAPEKLSDLVERQEKTALRQMISMITAPKLSGSWAASNRHPRSPRDTTGQDEPIDLSALYALLVEFKAETRRLAPQSIVRSDKTGSQLTQPARHQPADDVTGTTRPLSLTIPIPKVPSIFPNPEVFSANTL